MLSTLHTDDAPSTVTRLMDMGMEPYVIASALVGVVAQRLVRRLCPSCRRQYTPEADTLRALSIPEEAAAQFAFFRAVGCEECNHTGYRGRIAIYEVMRITDKVRRMIAQRAGEDMVRDAAVSAGMITLGEDGLAKVKSGVTTAEELLRVVTEVREMRTLCAACGGAVAVDFMACPHCGNRLHKGCAKCGRALQAGWIFCAFCASTTLLGLEPSAGADEIKHACRREIARYHPDKVQHLGQEFQEIAATRAAELTEAYRILMDPASRLKYDSHIGTGTAPAAGAAAAAPAQPGRSERETQTAEPPIPEAFSQTRATISEFVRKATLARVTDAAQALCDATAISVRGFDAAYLCRAKRGLFKKAEPPLSLVMRLVAAVDPSAIEDAWPFALKACAGDATLCMMLIGEGLAPVRELAAAVAEQRRRSRNPGPIVVPVDFRDWEALIPPETPSSVRALVERLRQADR